MSWRTRTYIVYEAVVDDGEGHSFLYIGRTGQGLYERKRRHIRDAARGSMLPLHQAIRAQSVVSWTVVWKGKSFHESMEEEIRRIRQARKEGKALLNLTRGGYHDGVDAGVVVAKRKPRSTPKPSAHKRRK